MASSSSSAGSAFSACSACSACASGSPEETSSIKTTPLPFPATSVITPVKFNGQNILSWEGYVLLWLRGQGLADHLTKKAIEIAEEERDQWMRIDYKLVRLLWQSVHPTLLVHFRSYSSCCDLWNRSCCGVGELLALIVRDGDSLGHLNKILSVSEEVEFFLTRGNVSEKLDTFLTLSVLHGLNNDLESISNEIVMKSDVTTV